MIITIIINVPVFQQQLFHLLYLLVPYYQDYLIMLYLLMIIDRIQKVILMISVAVAVAVAVAVEFVLVASSSRWILNNYYGISIGIITNQYMIWFIELHGYYNYNYDYDYDYDYNYYYNYYYNYNYFFI